MNALFARADHLLDAAFGAALNPLRHLGALAFLCFWVVAATGLWLYAGYDTSLAGAHASVMDFDANRWPAGSLARSLHRYASDALAALTALHLLRELARRHFGGFRTYAWITGGLAAVLLLASGVGGYWLVADDLAYFSLVATMEWFEALPLFAGSLVRNFLPGEPAADRFFSLLVFLHIGIPLAMLAMMWVHIRRLAHAVTNPPARLALPAIATLAALSLAAPAVARPAMDAAAWPARVAIDWFFLFAHPAMAALTPEGLWAVALAALAVLAAMPFASRIPRAPAARVNLDNCNGCARCFADCPYEAVVMVARTDGRPHPRMAAVDPRSPWARSGRDSSARSTAGARPAPGASSSSAAPTRPAWRRSRMGVPRPFRCCASGSCRPPSSNTRCAAAPTAWRSSPAPRAAASSVSASAGCSSASPPAAPRRCARSCPADACASCARAGSTPRAPPARSNASVPRSPGSVTRP